jgi:DUF4097 and DUF4098 domain-containing protein YvlB
MVLKKLFIALTVCVTFLFPLYGEQSDVIEKSFDIDGSKQVDINFKDIDGDVFVETHNKNVILFKFEKIMKGSKSRSRVEYFEGVQPEIDFSGNSLDIEIQYPRRCGLSSLFTSIRLNVVTHLVVPENTDLHVKVVDGNIDVDGLKGKLNLRSVDGDLKVANCEDSIALRTTDGDMDVMACKGFLRVYTTDGDVKADGVFMGLEFRSVDGDGNFSLLNGSLLKEDFNLRSTDGNIKLILPHNTGFKTNIRTTDGRIRTGDIPFDRITLKKRNRLSAERGNTEHSIEIKTVDGNVRLELQ